MILIFDTETTGFFHGSKPISHSDQPYIVQIAAALYEESGEEVSSFNFLVHNPGAKIHEGAFKAHGISAEKTERLGVSSRVAIAAFDALMARARLAVAHQVRFDQAIIEIARFRISGVDAPLGVETFCTMTAAKAALKSPKMPCIQHFFGEEMVGAHDAMVDVRACARVYFHLKSLGL